MVTGMSEGSTGSDVAVNLAATLARSGVSALLLSANTVHCAVSEAFDAHHRRGLADILRQNASVSEAVFDVPGLPGLRAMTAGSDGSLYSELLQSSHVNAVFEELADEAEVLVIDVAPTTVNADAQSLASMGTGVLLVAAEMRTERAEVVDAIDQLRHVSATLLGSVVATVQPPRLGEHKAGEAAPADPANTDGDDPDGVPLGGDPADGSSADGAPSERDHEEAPGRDATVLESTLVDLPAVGVEETASTADEVAPRPATGGAQDPGIRREDEDDDEDEDDEERPVYLRDRDREVRSRTSPFSLTRSGARPRWRDD